MAPARLHKVEEKKVMDKFEEVLMKHSTFFLLLFIIILLLLIVGVIIAIIHATTPMIGVDSGNYYYHLKEVI